MAPSATETTITVVENVKSALKPSTKEENGKKNGQSAETDARPKLEVNHRQPLKLSGALDQFKAFDVTPVIGREFIDVDLATWLRAPNLDELIRDLGITISQRGVVFFRKQDNITDDLQKELVQRLGELTGKPETSKLHIHPVNNAAREHGGKDDGISVISSEQAKSSTLIATNRSTITTANPQSTCGDTLWASGYELYDRISPTLRSFLDTLTAYYDQPDFNAAAEKNSFKLFACARGAPENIGDVLEAIHPVYFLDWFVRLIVENHDLQVRHRLNDVNDLVIWDNRSVYHSATPDYVGEEGLGERKGSRAVSLGEKSYFDPQSKSRREAKRT
ncbi:hypothetical protein INS49_007212 [Diaporthe citri]|uniref:uncharacterized protein n=1 Tax=Diaporthe citri TaxID=83186 RepID=UPI001C82344A|nr:uncharacterized protein INS49_007212 [Diaporthe citri]KAG6365601.1 hypothetical protein INS49_007212 [Diaporthe citri]